MKSFIDFIPLIIFYYLMKTTDPKNSNHPLLEYFGFSGATHGNDVLVATCGLVISMVLVYGILFVHQKFKFEKMQFFVLAITILMGGLTLALRDPIFIKIKAIIVNLIFASVFSLASHFTKDGSFIVEKIYKTLLVMPRKQWQYLNFSWVAMFIVMALLHALFAFVISDGKYWGEFTVFGDLLVMVTFLFVQLYCFRGYLKSKVDLVNENIKTKL